MARASLAIPTRFLVAPDKLDIKRHKHGILYVSVRKYQWRKKIIFIPSNKWENLKNILFYKQQIAYTNTLGQQNVFKQIPILHCEGKLQLN